MEKLSPALVNNHICATRFGVEDVIRNTALDMINYRRSQLAKGLVKKNNGNALPSATNMIKLKYSCKQERTARNVAKACAESSALPYGVQENFHLVAKNLAHSPVEALEMAVKYWWSQVELSNNSIEDAATLDRRHFNTSIMSFIKMAWAATLEMGCAVSEKQLCGTNWAVVCHYRTGPFRASMRVYITGQTCSSCHDSCENGLCVK